MKPSHTIIFSVMLIATIILSSLALVTSGIALNQSNKAIEATSSANLYSKNDDAAMALLAGKAAIAAFRLGTNMSIPAPIQKLWNWTKGESKEQPK